MKAFDISSAEEFPSLTVGRTAHHIRGVRQAFYYLSQRWTHAQVPLRVWSGVVVLILCELNEDAKSSAIYLPPHCVFVVVVLPKGAQAKKAHKTYAFERFRQINRGKNAIFS